MEQGALVHSSSRRSGEERNGMHGKEERHGCETRYYGGGTALDMSSRVQEVQKVLTAESTGPTRQAHVVPILRRSHQHHCRYAISQQPLYNLSRMGLSTDHPSHHVHDDPHGLRPQDLVLDCSRWEGGSRRRTRDGESELGYG